MTEAEWLTCGEPEQLFAVLAPEASSRKCILFSLACCCLEAGETSLATCKGNSGRAWRAAEEYADGLITYAVLVGAWFRNTSSRGRQAPFQFAPPLEPQLWAQCWARRDFGSAMKPSLPAGTVAHLVRDVFGNPFRPVALDPSWLTSTVVALAKGFYAERAFDGLPILADALQEAGCDNDDVLTHCRGNSPHTRGCWVIDALFQRR